MGAVLGGKQGDRQGVTGVTGVAGMAGIGVDRLLRLRYRQATSAGGKGGSRQLPPLEVGPARQQRGSLLIRSWVLRGSLF